MATPLPPAPLVRPLMARFTANIAMTGYLAFTLIQVLAPTLGLLAAVKAMQSRRFGVETLRKATKDERAASKAAAKVDGGVGAIQVLLDSHREKFGYR